MNQNRLMTVLRPGDLREEHLCRRKERTSRFRSVARCNKTQVKAAVELLFKVQVESVQMLNRPGKVKRFGRTMGRRSDSRRAYVSLKPGQRSNFGGRRNPSWHSVKSNRPLRAVARSRLSIRTCTRASPYAPLLVPQKRGSGRNNNGHITTRHKGGGHKHHYRIVDFRRNKDGIPAKVERLEYDQTAARSSPWFFTLMANVVMCWPEGLTAGDSIQSGAGQRSGR